jgi:hypothetical protein
MASIGDQGRGIEASGVLPQLSLFDVARMKPVWEIHKFVDPKDEVRALVRAGVPLDEIAKRFERYEILRFEGNLLLNEGINEAWKLIANTGGTKFDHTNAYIGVGTDSTAAVATQTGLNPVVSGSEQYNINDSVTVTNQSTAWVATFASGDANFHWQEITVCNTSADAGKNLNRKVQDMGTKASGTSWVATLTITLS